jgi:2-polyprenyl-3-methyl-5-hydroxy-6-metoxy-1,4-benzoquinol methylase
MTGPEAGVRDAASAHERAQQAAYEGPGGRAYDEENAGKMRTFHRKAALVAELLSRACPPGSAILEIGCGTGLFTEQLAIRLPELRIVATDAYDGVLKVAAQRLAAHANVDIVRHDAVVEWPDRECFDAVVGVDVIHHLSRPADAMSAWRLAVRRNGTLCFLETNPLNPVLFMRLCFRSEERRVFLNTTGHLKAWASTAGWADVQVGHAPFYLWSGGRRQADALSAWEDWMHDKLLWLRPFSGLLVLRARKA